ncbi:lipopolysaccharide biosynthesis protein [bacterium]|nr:lipopolysaccharide biosynthesis protein [bacterium]
MNRVDIKKIIGNLTKSEGRLSQKAIHSTFWVFAIRISGYLFSLVRLVIIARILAPRDFGLLGIALLTIATLETFSQMGFRQALIQKRGDTESYLNSIWTALILRGLILFTILFFIAPYAAIFFKTPAATLIIRVIGLSVVFQAFTNIAIVYFQKELEFHKQFFYQLSGTLANFLIAVPTALILRNVWALVFGVLAGNFVRFIVSYAIHPYRPHLTWDLRKAKELFGFGKWILGLSIITFLVTQGDDIFVGKIIGVAALGLYQIAFRFSNLPTTEITKAIGRVAFPMYSKLQDNISKFREGFLRVLEIISFLAFPLAAGIIVMGSDFVHLFLGSKWMPIVSILGILAVSGAIRAITDGSIFLAAGRPYITFWQMVIRLIVIAVSIYPLTIKFGIVGVAISILLGTIFYTPFWGYFSIRIIKGKYKDLLGKLVPSLLGAILMSLVILAIKQIIGQIGFVEFVSIIPMAIIVYLTFLFFWWRRFNSGPIESLRILKHSL